jgi:hypothetical protein
MLNAGSCVDHRRCTVPPDGHSLPGALAGVANRVDPIPASRASRHRRLIAVQCGPIFGFGSPWSCSISMGQQDSYAHHVQMFKLEYCPLVPNLAAEETTACPNGTGVRRGGHGLPVSQVARQVCWAVSDLQLLPS